MPVNLNQYRETVGMFNTLIFYKKPVYKKLEAGAL